ncbi:MAG: hypothetical protein WD750_12530 [Gammaproteobacteria bacterium]
MSLSLIQENLQSIYELEVAHNIQDFLITNREMARLLDADQSLDEVREKLLVYEDEDGLSLSLYLDEEVAGLFDDVHYHEQLDQQKIEEFCLALEGISHFLYLTWNATHDRAVTMMEMELQAEVDKFILLSRYFRERSLEPSPGQLRRLLFESAAYHESLGHEERKRYSDASEYAHKYCRNLESRYFSERGERQLLNELRRFYRLNKRDKLKRIDRIN